MKDDLELTPVPIDDTFKMEDIEVEVVDRSSGSRKNEQDLKSEEAKKHANV